MKRTTSKAMLIPKTLDECISDAKLAVKNWYNPQPTKREFIENNCNYLNVEHSEKFPTLKVFALAGGEPKGFVVVNYHVNSVIAFNYNCSKMKIWQVANNGWAYDELEPDVSRIEEKVTKR